VVTGLIAAHKTVAAFVRNSSTDTARQLRAAGAALVSGDLKSSATVDSALRGVDTVVCTANSTISRQQGDSIETVDHKGIQDLITAAEAAGVRHFVFISFSRNIQANFPLGAAKRAAERRLESSPMDYTILLPSYFAETWFSPAVGFDVAGGVIRVYGDGKSKVSYVARDDVAQATIACIDNAAVSRKSIPLGGAKAISQLDAVVLAEKANGRKMRVEFMTTEHIAAARKATQDPLTESFMGLFESLARGDEVPQGWGDLLGIKPQSMDEWFSHLTGH